MLVLSAGELSQLIGGTLAADASLPIGECVFNSAQVQPGQLFIALTTGARDGHEFCADALGRGAVLCITDRPIDGPHIQVDDTLAALQAIGRAHRHAVPGRVFAMTGSMGKTTTRRFLEAILSRRGPVLATRGNYNNHIGVPLTLSRYRDEQDVVLEMGANHQGEIAELRALGSPDIVAITLAGRAHLEGFGGIEGVIKGKGEILDDLPADGCAVLNADDAAFDTWQARVAGGRIVTFGRTQADVLAADVTGSQFTLQIGANAISVTLQIPGDHQINNALCAAAMAYADGVELRDIQAGLESVEPEAGRGRRHRHGLITLIDDSYNANPDAMNAAVRALVAESTSALAILGPMAELGQESDQAHREVGAQAQAAGLTELWTTDARIAQGFGAEARLFESVKSIQAALDDIKDQRLVLVKGSRSAAMEGCFAHWMLGE